MVRFWIGSVSCLCLVALAGTSAAQTQPGQLPVIPVVKGNCPPGGQIFIIPGQQPFERRRTIKVQSNSLPPTGKPKSERVDSKKPILPAEIPAPLPPTVPKPPAPAKPVKIPSVPSIPDGAAAPPAKPKPLPPVSDIEIPKKKVKAPDVKPPSPPIPPAPAIEKPNAPSVIPPLPKPKPVPPAPVPDIPSVSEVPIKKPPVAVPPPIPIGNPEPETKTTPKRIIPIPRSAPRNSTAIPAAAYHADTPWVIRVEVVDKLTHLHARSRDVEFRVVCQSLDIRTPADGIQAGGDVQVHAAGLNIVCQKLMISWKNNWVQMEGAVRLATEKDGQRVELTGDQLRLKLTSLAVQETSDAAQILVEPVITWQKQTTVDSEPVQRTVDTAAPSRVDVPNTNSTKRIGRFYTPIRK